MAFVKRVKSGFSNDNGSDPNRYLHDNTLRRTKVLVTVCDAVSPFRTLPWGRSRLKQLASSVMSQLVKLLL